MFRERRRRLSTEEGMRPGLDVRSTNRRGTEPLIAEAPGFPADLSSGLDAYGIRSANTLRHV